VLDAVELPVRLNIQNHAAACVCYRSPASRTVPSRLFIIVLAVVRVVRLVASPLRGTEDVEVWKLWSYAGGEDVLGVYGVGGTPPERRLLEFRGRYTTVDYPPVALYEMAIVGTVYRALFPDYPK